MGMKIHVIVETDDGFELRERYTNRKAAQEAAERIARDSGGYVVEDHNGDFVVCQD